MYISLSLQAKYEIPQCDNVVVLIDCY